MGHLTGQQLQIMEEAATNMKMCIYAICKNEIKHIDRWLEAVKDADEVVVLDTGSIDGTWEVLQASGVKCEQKIIEPFRFDAARNYALSLISDDCEICLPLDIDMFLTNDFCKRIKNVWETGLSILQMPLYHLNTNNLTSKFAHARHGCVWVYPVHEQVQHKGYVKSTIDVMIIHDRIGEPIAHEFYLPLAEVGIKENPYNPYCQKVYQYELEAISK